MSTEARRKQHPNAAADQGAARAGRRSPILERLLGLHIARRERVQLLDGVTGAVVTVLTILVITDLTTGTGRFNLAQGVLGTMRGIAAAVGTASVGFIVQQFGDLTGFLLMAAGPVLGALLIWAFLPETKPAKYLD